MCDSGWGAADYAALSQAECIAELARLQRAKARLEAAELRLLAALDAQADAEVLGNGDEATHWIHEEIACVLKIAPSSVANRVATARQVVADLPEAVALLESGAMTGMHVRRLADGVLGLPLEVAKDVAAQVLPRAGEQSVGQFGASVRRAVLRSDDRSSEVKTAAAQAERRVAFTPSEDGMTVLWALLPADAATAAKHRVDHLAGQFKDLDRVHGIERNADQRRADALLTLLTGATRVHPRDGHLALGPQINVTVALSTLLELDDQPGELDGHGPIPAALARRLADDPTGTWRRLVTDDVGNLLDVTSSRYRPPTALARFITVRTLTCTFPGCSRSSRRSELDHVIDWADGGPTNASNLHPLCPRHHHAKPRRRLEAAP